jgi:small subunit ribosomal protein S6
MLLREYETIYILRPDLTDDEVAGVKEKVANIFSREEGHVLHQDVWGKKKLSYEIKKQPKGIYIHLSYLGGPATTNEIERNLRLMEPVLKYQTLRVAKDVDVDRRLAERDAEEQSRAAAAARREAEEKERELKAAEDSYRESDNMVGNDADEEREWSRKRSRSWLTEETTRTRERKSAGGRFLAGKSAGSARTRRPGLITAIPTR